MDLISLFLKLGANLDTRKVCVIYLTLFENSYESFIAALDDEKISHSQIKLFSNRSKALGIVEVISALSDAMPWNAIAKVIVAWINARKSREIVINMEDGRVINAKGYSASEVKDFLAISINISIIDNKPANSDGVD